MSSASYLPVTRVPFHGSSSKIVAFTALGALRRRAVFAGLLTTSLLVLFVLLRYTLKEFDIEGAGLDILSPSVDLLAYLPLEIPKGSSLSARLKPVRGLPISCLDAHFALGEICYEKEIQPIDVLWTWVNGSDPLLQRAKSSAQERYERKDPYRPMIDASSQARLYRDHDELRHSLRSVLQHFRGYTTRFHVLTADFPVPRTPAPTNATNSTSNTVDSTINYTLSDSWRLGQIPQWLDLDKRTDSVWKDGSVALSLKHHAEIFTPYEGTNFNSLAIESQLTHLQDISENFIYMNDDLFMMNPMTHTSFYTSAYGVVLHLQSNLLVPPTKPHPRTQGEWKSMGLTNTMLGTRFGIRYRPYVVHEAKTASVPLLHEMALMWPGQFALTATHAFRETQGGDGDVNTMFLLSHFVVERAREALLWSWIVGRVGGLEDEWGEREASLAWAELGGGLEDKGLLVQTEYRDTLEKSRVEKFLKESGHKGQGKTTYVFSSLDGYPYTTLGTSGQPRWPSMARDTGPGDLPSCRISYQDCFTTNEGFRNSTTTASGMFMNLAFRKPRCGDCAIMALVHASGSIGLSKFLPSQERTLPASLQDGDGGDQPAKVPHLPLVADWQNGDFSLRAVMNTTRTSSVKDWALQLLQRYRYMIGETPSLFERITSPKQLTAVLNRIDAKSDIALLCLNDDVAIERVDAPVTAILKKWQSKQWTRRASWEKS
ncbi:3-O-alpha-D-mannopyranosyl-alpha-D-mannopyranose xylosylphosphotransferase [Sparassis crispa]|uniref:3-O-alpha-D-mannopyranosyl-alpha-D-mannopyranose xylosylphosphotransferase n=1 Tax=Sparassis crispa TaxID=139825 RepID=A0A401GSN7_9APHY|nr:3-O-alpha-D-mannopyranosyl-alpha-D-mannopyranose xylosylphosphotransferase [Sparassis crispa]GBE85251.1 3-O-alpha-D-mannopyranosyl-alpha-D-mannopyranose xylosylphosphotransferase [Sparassis crispa]